MAKKTNNLKKFGKLASLVKKVADKNPDFLQQILDESDSKSKRDWNKIQKWTSKNLFQEFKKRPLKDFTLKNVEQAINKDVDEKKKSKCYNVFAIPDADLGVIEIWDLEDTIKGFPPNLQIQIDLQAGDNLVNTGIVKAKDLYNADITAKVREMYPNVDNVTFFRLRKQGKKAGDRANCSYYIKVATAGVRSKEENRNEPIDFFLSEDEKNRRVVKGIAVSDLTDKQKVDRKKLKALLDAEKKAKKKIIKKRQFKTPDKVIEKKVVETKTEKKKKAKDTKEEIALLKQKERNAKQFNIAVEKLERQFDKGIFTAKEFKIERAKLEKKILLKGGEI